MEEELLHPLNDKLVEEANKFIEQFSKLVIAELDKIQKDVENLENVLKYMESPTKP